MRFKIVMVGTLLALGGLGSSARASLIGSTNLGELVSIDVSTGIVALIGKESTGMGWTDVAFAPSGDLFATSRRTGESDGTNHLYKIDKNTGQIISSIGSTGEMFVGDIEFSSGSVLFGNYFVNPPVAGHLSTIDTSTAVLTPTSSIFGSSPLLQNGGLGFHPLTGQLWGIESSFVRAAGRIFQINSATGVASNIVDLNLGGFPTGFGFDSLAILNDGRFFGTRGGRGSQQIYEINPTTGTVTQLSLTIDSSITGHLNGLSDFQPVPEPSTIALLGSALGPLGYIGYRRRRRRELHLP